jgi:hypothetical protein
MKLMSVQGGGSLQGNENHVRSGRHFVPMQPEEFSELPLDPISSASCPDFPAGHYPQPQSARWAFQHSDVKMGRTVADSFFANSPIVRG